MDKIKIRPHHIDSLVKYRNMESESDKNVHRFFYEKLYDSSELFDRKLEFAKSLDESTLLEIVSKNDILCEIGCPYYDDCLNENWESMRYKANQKLPKDYILKDCNVKEQDKNALEKHGITENSVYPLSNFL